MRGLAVDLRRVRQQDRELATWDRSRRLLDIVDAVEVRIVDPGQMQPGTILLDHVGFVQEHADAHVLELRDHADRVVVAQHPVDRAFQMRPHPRHALERGGPRGQP